MSPEKIKEEFAKFYAGSPFIGRTSLTPEQVEIAMYGSYMAGFALLGEELKKHL